MWLHFCIIMLVIVLGACSPKSPEPKGAAATIFPKSQISSYIRRIYQDHKGNIWLGTTQDGVCKYDGSTLNYLSKNDGLAGVCIKAMIEDTAGNLWLATENGISRYDGKRFTNYTARDGLAGNDVFCMLFDRNSVLWVGTTNGVSRFDGKAFNTFVLPGTNTVSANPRFKAMAILAICEAANGDIWFGTGGSGVLRYNGNTFTTYTEKDGLPNNSVWCISQDRNDNLWFGTRGGGATSYNGKTFTTFSEQDGLAGNNISDILQDKSGNIWFATSGRGVAKYDGNKFSTIKDQSGITENHVQCIYQDRSGRLWFGFSGGLFRLENGVLVNVTKTGPWE